jgi:hypothetical protein
MGKSTMYLLKYYYPFAVHIFNNFEGFFNVFCLIKELRIHASASGSGSKRLLFNFQQLCNVYAYCSPPCYGGSCHSSSGTPCPLLAPAPPPSAPERWVS